MMTNAYIYNRLVLVNISLIVDDPVENKSGS